MRSFRPGVRDWQAAAERPQSVRSAAGTPAPRQAASADRCAGSRAGLTGWGELAGGADFDRGKEASRTVQVLTKEKAPRYRRPEGALSYLLASPRTSQAKHLTTTLVQIDPGGEQPIHKHAPEQVYFVLEGSGLM